MDTIHQIALIIETCLRSIGNVYLMGNGVSAADAQQIAGVMMGKLPALIFIACFGSQFNTAVLNSIANDYDYTQVLSRQLEGLAEKGDVVI